MASTSWNKFPLKDYPGGVANSAGAITTGIAGSVMGWRSYTACSAASGTSYGARLNHYVTGAGGSGAAVRAYGLVKGVAAANLYGIEASAEIMSTASSGISGLAAAGKFDVIANLDATGTLAVLDLSYNVATGKSVQGVTSSFIRVGNTGAGTGSNVLFEFTTAAGSQSATALVSTVKTAATNWSHGARSKLSDGTPVWFMLTTTSPAA